MSLLDDFYADDPRVFQDWIGDALTDHDIDEVNRIRSLMLLINMRREFTEGGGERDSYLHMLEMHRKLEISYRDLGEYIFQLVDTYIREADRRIEDGE